MGESPSKEFVADMRANSPVYQCLWDTGKDICSDSLVQENIDGYELTYSESFSEKELKRIRTAVQAVQPAKKACYSNSFQLWAYDSRFSYCEGVATVERLDFTCPHAWNMWSGRVIDVTNHFDSYYGIQFEDETTRSYFSLCLEENVWGILKNHASGFEFLKSEGYL